MFSYDSESGKVSFELKSTELKINFSEDLGGMFGFSSITIYDQLHKKYVGNRRANLYFKYEYLYLCCSLCENVTVDNTILPVLRTLAMPTEKLMHSSRITLTYDKIAYVPLCTSVILMLSIFGF